MGDESSVSKAFSRLTRKKKWLLLSVLIKKILPLYDEFWTDNYFGDPQLISTVVTSVDGLLVGDKDQKEMNTLMSKLDENIPDMDDFGSVSASNALDAGSMCEILLKGITEKETNLEDGIELFLDVFYRFKVEEETIHYDIESKAMDFIIKTVNYISSVEKIDHIILEELEANFVQPQIRTKAVIF